MDVKGIEVSGLASIADVFTSVGRGSSSSAPGCTPPPQPQGMERPQILVYVEKSLNYSAFDVRWVPRSARVVALGSHPRGTGALQVRRTFRTLLFFSLSTKGGSSWAKLEYRAKAANRCSLRVRQADGHTLLYGFISRQECNIYRVMSWYIFLGSFTKPTSVINTFR